ncbi:hypothetical protein [Enterococcus sp. 7F3_DIV0205]|uniref:hypothetical protein n=1 Tax=Candidatus Enterococcus palustris TaxID=1834189 RepID=UPI00201DBEBF
MIANKCYSCKKYYACFHCHNKLENHIFLPWPISIAPDTKVVLCGNCEHEMTATEYMAQTECLNCKHSFNPNCSIHDSIYFS